MTIRLLSVGRPREPHAIALHDGYAERLRRLGFDYRAESVPDVRGGKYSADHVRELEARALERRLGDRRCVTVIALDPAGEMLDSPRLARRLERWSPRGVTLVIGGPTGLHEGLVERADGAWSLSRLTFPHELVRAIVAEQLYRAATLLRNIPYHK
jgi:23S rRNA (pseudouridine1915-N3)-methyltransferase